MSVALYRNSVTVVIIAVLALAGLLVACDAAPRQHGQSNATVPALASTRPVASGQGAPEGDGGGLTVQSAGDTLTFAAAAYCKACSGSIVQAVAALAGVNHAAADPSAATFRIVVQYDPERVNAERITEEVQTALTAYNLNKLILHRTAVGVELSSGRFT
jgi:copper chaperone CopZ